MNALMIISQATITNSTCYSATAVAVVWMHGTKTFKVMCAVCFEE